MKQTATLDEAIDMIALLPPEQREMLMEILHHRQIDGRREEIAQYAQQWLPLIMMGNSGRSLPRM